MVQAMVLSSFLVAGVAFLFAAVILKRAQNPDDPGGVPTMAVAPLPALPPLEARPAPGPEPILPAPAARPVYPEPAPVPAAATRSARNNSSSRFAPRPSRSTPQAVRQ